MSKRVELLIGRKKALMNECFSKSNAYNADGVELSEEINDLVDLVENIQTLTKANSVLADKLEKLEKKK